MKIANLIVTLISEEEILITSLDSIRDTPLRELYSDILHFVADPEGESLAKKVRLAQLNRSEMHDYNLLEDVELSEVSTTKTALIETY